MAVMVLIVGMMSSMLGAITQNWRDAQKRVNNFSKARAMLDMMAHDIQSGVFRPDLPAFPLSGSTSSLEFYTLRPGISTTGVANLRNVSAVQYAFAAAPDISVLQRSDQAVLFNQPATLAFGSDAAFPATTPRDTAPGIIDFKFVFMQQDGSMGLTYYPANTLSASGPTRSIGITLAVVDDQTMAALSQAQVTTLRSGLDGALNPQLPNLTDSVKSTWSQYLNTSIAWKTYPQGLGIGFTIFERYVVLPTSP